MSRVAVIVPVYNALPYLPEVRESLDAQTYGDFRIVLVDDGSIDGSSEYLEKWCAEDARCALIVQENKGLSGARNSALDLLRREEPLPDYLLFLDADDKLRSDALEMLVARADAEQLDVLEFAASAFFESAALQIRLGHYESYYLREVPADGVLSGPAYAALLARNGLFLSSACLHFVRASLLFDNDIRFYPGIIHEDNLYTFQCLLDAARVAYLPEPLYLRRVRENSIMSVPVSWKNAAGYFRCAQEAVKELDEHTELTEEEIRGFNAIASLFFDGSIGACESLSEDEIAQGVAGLRAGEQLMFERTVLKPMHQRAEQQRLERELADTAERAGQLERELTDTVKRFEESPSFRLGRALTAVPRKILRR